MLHKIKALFNKLKRGNKYLNCPYCKKTLTDYNFKCRKHEGTACEYTRKGYIKESDYYPKRMPDYEGWALTDESPSPDFPFHCFGTALDAPWYWWLTIKIFG